MEITGKIIHVLERVGGTSKAGNQWEKQEYVLETQDQYPKKICFQIFGSERIEQAALKQDELVTVQIDIDSREYQGRWFTNINAWRVDRNANQGAGQVPPQPGDFQAAATPDSSANDSVDDLPF